MKFATKEKDSQEINITPLIDVVFILLIFFMVTTTFVKEAKVTVNLPKAAQVPLAEKEQPYEIMIDSKGNFFVAGKALSSKRPSVIKQALQDLTRNNKNKALILRADANTPHQSVVTAMDVAAQLGLVKLSIATTRSTN